MWSRTRTVSGLRHLKIEMDLLADIVAALDLRTSLYFRAQFSAPYAVRVPEDRQRVRFHVAAAGRTWVGLPTGEGAWLSAGDVVLVPHGGEHVLAHSPDESPSDLDEVEAAAPLGADGVLRFGGEGSESDLVCGHFEFDEAIVHPVIASLPPLVHLPAGGGPGYAWLLPLLEFIERERWEEAPGRDAVSVRISEILFIQLLRAHQAQASDDVVLSALGDEHLGRVLEAVHADPGAQWSLETLSTVAGLSRSVLAERFRDKLGTSPMRYVGEWRVQRARRLLRDDSLSVGEIGRRVGYASEAAFNRVFSQSVGEAPGRYRRSRGEPLH